VQTIALDVDWIGQAPGLCGPACAQMILASLKQVGTSLAVQQELWVEIKTRTGQAAPAPAKAKNQASSSLCGTFPHQICEDCGQGSSFCWCTHPVPLAATLSAHGAPAGVVITNTELDLTTAVITSIQASNQKGDSKAPIVLVRQATHWVVVYGFVFDETGATGTPIAKLHVTEMLIRDPELNALNNSCSIDHWFASYLRDIPCGQFKNKQVMVA
jgi:hypothetical protein